VEIITIDKTKTVFRWSTVDLLCVKTAIGLRLEVIRGELNEERMLEAARCLTGILIEVDKTMHGKRTCKWKVTMTPD
jgi:hypothetical protein